MSNFTVVETETLQQGITRLFGGDSTISESTPVAGGCINQGRRLRLSTGTTLFCKKTPWKTRACSWQKPRDWPP